MGKLRALLYTLLILRAAAPVLSEAAPTDTAPQVRIQADNEEYSFDTQQFTADGNAAVSYKDITLRADLVTGNPWTGDVQATGEVSFEGEGRILTSDNFIYNFKTEKGLAQDASAMINGIHFLGDKLESEPNRYTLTHSRFTTCDAAEPHYYVSAGELAMEPGEKLTAQDVSFVFFGGRVLNIPKYTLNLSEDRQEKSDIPPIGISGKFGIHASFEYDLSREPRTIGMLDVRLSTKQVVQGGLMYDRFAGRPIFLRATLGQPYYGGVRSDTSLSRLPEVGIRFGSERAARQLAKAREPVDLSRRVIDPLRTGGTSGDFNVLGEIGVGRFFEDPRHVSHKRLDARAVAWLDPMHIDSRTLVSPGVSARFSNYDNGDHYSVLGFQLAAARRFGSNSFLSLTYITHSIHGTTPFEFDRVELADELAGKIRFPVGNLTLEIARRYDLQAHRFFDTEISIAKTLHCIEPSITWRNRFQEFSIDVRLIGL